MQTLDQQVLQAVQKWLSQELNCWLATVVATYGSSPRPVGSVMACNTEGTIVGSLSGGCVEEDLIDQILGRKVATSLPEVVRYGEDEEDNSRFELPCGGILEILVESIPAVQQNVDFVDHIVDRIAQRMCIKRIVNLATGNWEINDQGEGNQFVYHPYNQLLIQSFGPVWQLFIVGSNSVAEYLAMYAQSLDYRVFVVDSVQSRLDAFANNDVSKICDLPDDVLREMANDQNSAVVAVSHDPRLDDMALVEALDTDVFYIGAMGSARTTAKRIERLSELHVPPDQLARLHAPIGLSIGSKTPPEIAISIMAEITQVRNELTIQSHRS